MNIVKIHAWAQLLPVTLILFSFSSGDPHSNVQQAAGVASSDMKIAAMKETDLMTQRDKFDSEVKLEEANKQSTALVVYTGNETEELELERELEAVQIENLEYKKKCNRLEVELDEMEKKCFLFEEKSKELQKLYKHKGIIMYYDQFLYIDVLLTEFIYLKS